MAPKKKRWICLLLLTLAAGLACKSSAKRAAHGRQTAKNASATALNSARGNQDALPEPVEAAPTPAGAAASPGNSLPIPDDLTQFDNRLYAQLLAEFVDANGLVDYAGLKANRASLDAYVDSFDKLAPETLAQWKGTAQMAFWLNAYNAIILRAVIGHAPLKAQAPSAAVNWSVRQIPGLWDALQTPVMGKPMTLDQIEHATLRQQFNDARIHMALACGTLGAPPLRAEPYDAARLDDQLALQAQRFFSSAARLTLDRPRRVMRVSQILGWFSADFTPIYDAQAPSHSAATPRDVIVWFVTQNSDAIGWNESKSWKVEFLPYDWRLNIQSPKE